MSGPLQWSVTSQALLGQAGPPNPFTLRNVPDFSRSGQITASLHLDPCVALAGMFRTTKTFRQCGSIVGEGVGMNRELRAPSRFLGPIQEARDPVFIRCSIAVSVERRAKQH